MARRGPKKPLYGSKKYSLLALPCSVKDCSEEFFVCKPDGKRYCETHTFVSQEGDAPVRENRPEVKRMLELLGLTK